MSAWDWITGTPDSDKITKAINGIQAPNAAAYQMGAVDQSGLTQAGNNGQTAFQAMMNQAQGRGPSIANAQMQSGLSQAANNAMTMAAANRTAGGAGLADAMNAGAKAAAGAAGQGAIARAAEQQAALQGLTSAVANQGNIGAHQAAINEQIAATKLGANMGYDQAGMENSRLKSQELINQATQEAGGFGRALSNIGKVAGIGGSILSIPGVLPKNEDE